MAALAVTLTFMACRKDEGKGGGLPPADDWEAPAGEVGAPKVETPPAAATTGSASADNPHAGMGTNPHADLGANPYAGMGTNPHAGMGMSASGHGVPGGDPAATVDESKFLDGTITASPKMVARVKPGSVIFISVHRYDPKSEGPVGSALATDKLDSVKFPAKFHLTGHNAMGGGGFEGDVVVSAWTDQDRDAISKQPGDVIGRVRATIPAKGLELKLDTVLE